MKRHKVLVHGLKKFQCNVCATEFSQSERLKEHVKRIHEETKDYACQLCGKEFVSKPEMRKHVETVHDM